MGKQPGVNIKRHRKVKCSLLSLISSNGAIKNSSKGKRRRERVQRILDKEDVYVEQIREMLAEKTYVPGGYIEEQIWDQNGQKGRTVFKPKYYPDQIVHWCLMRGMYYCQREVSIMF